MENEEKTPEIEESPKKQPSSLNYVALAIVIFFGGYFLFIGANTDDAIDDNEVDIEFAENIGDDIPDGKGGNAGLLTANQFGEAGENNLWKHFKDLFTLEAPHEWEVHQIDAGPVSIVEVYEPSDPNHSVTIWLQDAKMDFEGIELSFMDWINGSTQNMTNLQDCDNEEIGHFEMACITGDIGEEHWRMYFAPLNDDVYVGVFKPIEEAKATPLWGIINTIEFKASDKALKNAIVIP